MKKASILLRSQIALLQPTFNGSIESARKAQDMLGEIEAKVLSKKVRYIPQHRGRFDADFAVPIEPRLDSIIMYIHGGGYTAGSLEYAKGFGGMLANKTNISVLCLGYRLAPEFTAPAALEDALEAYRFLVTAYSDKAIFLAGESAGGGLCYALALKLKELGIKLPNGIVAMSPWTDLTLSFPSHIEKAEIDPSLTTAQLDLYASLYAPNDRRDPYVSPVFGELSGLPDSLIITGSNEILLDDSREMAKRLNAAESRAILHIEDGAWHAYPLYNTYEARQALTEINAFISEKITK